MTRFDAKERKPPTGVQAAEVVLRVLGAFVGADRQLMLKTIAEQSGLHPAKAHRYLAGLRECGFVAQDQVTGLYHLADAAVELGFAALEAIDPVVVARPVLMSLREETGHSATFAVWSDGAPVVALQAIRREPLMLTTQVGSRLSLFGTASGLTFLAWLPSNVTEAAIKTVNPRDVALELRSCLRTPVQLEKVLARIREDGVAAAKGGMNVNVHGLAVPVFDGESKIAGVVGLLGLPGRIDLDLNGKPANALREAAGAIGFELGGARPG